MFYAIYNVIALTNSVGTAPPSAEAILDQTFQLVMLALAERLSFFSHVSVIKPFAEEKKPTDIICTIKHDEKYKPYKSCIAAKTRQEAIMAEMKAQQASFLLNFEEEEEENDQDMDETSDELSSYGTCIVCQEDLNEAKVFGSLWPTQPSRLVRKCPDSHSQYLNELMIMPQSFN
ncbi:hypothetical protein EV702DRAFT_1250808 [Suillus placidus]|uniref:E3 ubiquitin-protein ligase n=1 Tax=Suillus placidus TaxID=48579 RepID=A0A9P6ZM30_9AGAM|nr:hypothetical protein EV702DRAFT_1250808 [Suillus placidus]